VAEQSQKEEMSAAIRAHRERRNVPRSIAPEPLPTAAQAPAPQPARPKSLLARLFAK
jgi:hypothetical protein